MSLSPTVLGPLSECNTSVEVAGQTTGAKTRIYSNGRLVAEGVARWSHHVFPLLPGERINANELVVATQDLGRGPGRPTSEPAAVRVQKASPPGPLSLMAPPFACGQAVFVTGAVPGATVTVKEGVKILGTKDAPRGHARMFLNSMITRGGVLLASQEACGVKSGDTAFPPADSPPDVIPAPKILGPLLECQRSITVEDVLAGALVTVQRSSGPILTAWWDSYRLIFIDISPPLQKGETLTAWQEFPACQLRSVPSLPVTVEPTTPVPVPRILGGLCAGSHGIRLSKLTPGCQIKIYSDGVELGAGEAFDSVCTFSVPELKTGAHITARQALCDIWSNPSNTVVVGPGSTVRPLIVGLPVACSTAVRVAAAPGSWVTITSAALGQIGRAFFSDNEMDIPVLPLLIDGDVITATSVGCNTSVSDPVTVREPPQELNAPGIGKVMQLMSVVPVTGVLPGATVDVYVNGLCRGSDFCALSTKEIGITGQLAIGDSVAARQRLCKNVSVLTMPAVTV